MAEGIDISEHQGYWPPDRFRGWEFAILRARNEHGSNDVRFQDHWRSAAGIVIRGVYGWPIAGAGGVFNFYAGAALVKDFPGSEMGYWADVEHSGRGLASLEEVEQYIEGIKAAGGVPGLYSNIGDLPRSPLLDSIPWWMADYGPNDGTRHDPYEQRPYPPADRAWAIHQYTSNPLDVNFAPVIPGTTPPSTTKRKDSDLYVALIIGLDGLPYAFLVSGNVILKEFPPEPRGFLAIPQAALDFAGDSVLLKNLADLPGAWETLVQASDNVLSADLGAVRKVLAEHQTAINAATADIEDLHRDTAALYLADDGLHDLLLKTSKQRLWSGARKVLQTGLS